MIKSNLNKVFSNSELYTILDAVFQRRFEAKIQVEMIEDGRKDSSYYDYWNKVYNDCNNVYIKLINCIVKERIRE